MNSDAVVTTVRGERIRVADVIAHLKLKGIFRTAIYELIEQEVLRLTLRDLGVPVDEAEVADRARKKRAAMGIEDEAAFAKYLRYYGVTAEQWLDSVRCEATRDLVKTHVITAQKISDSYRRDPRRFASVSVARIACRTREDADLVLRTAREGGRDFVELARDFSADENTRLAGGFIGQLRRGMLPAEVDRQAFTASEGDVIGPFRENGLWTVYKIHSLAVPKLSDALKNVIRDQLFGEWLREQVLTVPA